MQKKKCLLSMLVCLGAGPVFAQSSVTLYGNVDNSIGYYNTGGENTVRMNSGSTWGSRFGLRGSEDIGGDNKVIFLLEEGLNTGNGQAAVAGDAFSRQSWVGISGDYGALMAGLLQTPVYVPSGGYYDAFQVNTMASGFNNFSVDSVRESDAIRYDSPTIAGFKMQLMAGLRDATTSSNGIGNYHVAVEYNRGPWALASSYQSVDGQVGAGTLRAFFGGGSYAIGNLAIFAGYHHATQTNGTVNNNDYTTSLRYSITPFSTVSAGYAWVHSDGSTAPGTADQFSLLYRTWLSKVTEIYASVSDLSNRGKTAFTLNGATVAGVPAAYPGASVRGAEIGMLHFF